MIYWFSGTGNSQWVAEQLSRRLGDRLINIAECIARNDFRHSLATGESIGWVFPTYSWGPPPVVLDFVSRWHIDGYEKNTTYCYMATTCGDDVGLAADIFAKALGYIGLVAAFSIQMPNNYILLPGFDTDPAQMVIDKKAQAVKRIDHVANAIANHTHVIDVVTGKYKWIKSRIIRPFFVRHLMSDKHFTHRCAIHAELAWRNAPCTTSPSATTIAHNGMATAPYASAAYIAAHVALSSMAQSPAIKDVTTSPDNTNKIKRGSEFTEPLFLYNYAHICAILQAPCVPYRRLPRYKHLLGK